MNDRQYSKRFISKLNKYGLLTIPFLLIITLLFNNFIIDLYYRITYTQPYRKIARTIAAMAEKEKQLPVMNNVSYRKLSPGAKDYTYLQESYRIAGHESTYTRFITTLTLNGEKYEVTIARLHPGGNDALPDARLVLISAIISLLFFFVLNWFTVRFIMKRVTYNLWRSFYQNLRRINTFNVHEGKQLELVPTGTREFEYFNQAILGFTEKIQKTHDEMREFIENTAHELQTPLAVVLAKTELILKHNQLNEQDKKELQDIRKTIQRLSSIQKTLNQLSRIRHQHYTGKLEKNTLSINHLLKESVVFYEELIQYKQLDVVIREEASLHTFNNIEMVRMLIDNLLRNAIQHNYTGGVIDITITAGNFSLSNTGTAPAENTEDLFKRYTTKSKDDGRLGLGLAIVKAICENSGYQCSYVFNKVRMHCFIIQIHSL